MGTVDPPARRAHVDEPHRLVGSAARTLLRKFRITAISVLPDSCTDTTRREQPTSTYRRRSSLSSEPPGCQLPGHAMISMDPSPMTSPSMALATVSRVTRIRCSLRAESGANRGGSTTVRRAWTRFQPARPYPNLRPEAATAPCSSGRATGRRRRRFRPRRRE